MKMHLSSLKCQTNQTHKMFLPFCLRSIKVKPIQILMLFVPLVFSGCAYHQKIPFEKTKTLYQGQDVNDSLILGQTPFLLTHSSTSTYNRIGRPSARYDDQGEEQIYV